MSKPPPEDDPTTHTCFESVCPHVWVQAESDPNLQFLNSSKSVKRPGGAGCYPAAVSNWVPEDGWSAFVVTVTEHPSDANWLSFGVAQTFAVGLQTSVGHHDQSVGFRFDSRGGGLYSDGSVLCKLPGIEQGDVLAVAIDCEAKRVRFCRNGKAVTHKHDNEGWVLMPDAENLRCWVTLNNDAVLTIS
eukprot:m.21475 g.21475  ORF g.21475 m.21475 type:complete len:188 (-) comp6434_c0_seq1:47-610(-)